jgi:DNA repair protein RecN (Recombination protein N)
VIRAWCRNWCRWGVLLIALRGKTTAPVDSWADDVAAALSTLRDRAADIDRALFDLDGGGETLEQIDDRLYALRGLARKLGCAPAGIVTAWDRLRAEHQAGVNAEDQVGALTAALAAAKQTYDRLAADLSAARAKARTTLDRAVMKELPPLKLDKAIFVTEQIITEPGPTGIDQLRFMVAPNPGLPPAPLDKNGFGRRVVASVVGPEGCFGHAREHGAHDDF